LTTSRTPFSFRWPLLILYSVFLYVAFTLPAQKIPPAVAEANDKIIHVIVFFIYALLAFRTFFYSSRPLFHNDAGLKSVGLSLFYGAFLEWVQWNVSGRSASFTDWLADLAGTLAASAIFRISRLPRRGYPDPLND